MLGEHGEQPAAVDVGDPHQRVLAGGHQQAAVGAEFGGQRRAAVLADRAHERAGRGVPHLHHALLAAGHHAAVNNYTVPCGTSKLC